METDSDGDGTPDPKSHDVEDTNQNTDDAYDYEMFEDDWDVEEAPLDQNADDWDASDPIQDQNADDLDPNDDDLDMVAEEQGEDDDGSMWEAPTEPDADLPGEDRVDENTTMPVQIVKDDDLSMWRVPEEETRRTPEPEWLDPSSTTSPQSEPGSSQRPTSVKSNVSLPDVASCQGHCGSKSYGSCWCDSLCKDTDSCCPDYDLYCGQGKYIPPRQEDEKEGQDPDIEKVTPTCVSTCYTNSEEASPVKNGCCLFPFFFDANDDGEVEEHNTCIEVAEGGWCSTHVDQEGRFQEGRWGYCQREGCEFRTPVLGASSSSSPRPSTGLPDSSTSSSSDQSLNTTLLPTVTEGTVNSTQQNTDAPIIITPLPLLPLPDLLPPPGTPISIPCGMFDPIQAALPVHLRSC